MLVIRKEQVEAFKSASDADFERRLLLRLSEPFPRCKEIHGEAALTAMVRLGLERAHKLGLEREDDILRYLWTMLLLGSEFGTDPQLSWATAALTTPESLPPAQRVAVLWEQAQAYRRRVMGPDDGLYVAALRSIEGKTVEDLTKLASRSQRDLLMQLVTLFPQKFKEVGEQAFSDLTRLAIEACRPYEMLDRWAVVLMVELMFLFGAGIMSDPLTAWAREALKKESSAEIDRKLGALLKAAHGCIEKLVAAH